jgi:uncharacterized membrane protein YkvA (DUF1232 family)
MTIRFLLLLVARRLRKQSGLYRKVMGDPRTPGMAKILLGAAVFYMMLPFDFIPDFIPFIGLFDDAFVLPALIGVAFFLVPQQVWRDARQSIQRVEEVKKLTEY